MITPVLAVARNEDKGNFNKFLDAATGNMHVSKMPLYV